MKNHSPDPELQLQRDEHLHNEPLLAVFLWFFVALGLFVEWLLNRPRVLGHWLRWQTVCAWCLPPHRLRGNPWARHKTHSICRPCAARQSGADNYAELHAALARGQRIEFLFGDDWLPWTPLPHGRGPVFTYPPRYYRISSGVRSTPTSAGPTVSAPRLTAGK